MICLIAPKIESWDANSQELISKQIHLVSGVKIKQKNQLRITQEKRAVISFQILIVSQQFFDFKNYQNCGYECGIVYILTHLNLPMPAPKFGTYKD